MDGDPSTEGENDNRHWQRVPNDLKREIRDLMEKDSPDGSAYSLIDSNGNG